MRWPNGDVCHYLTSKTRFLAFLKGDKSEFFQGLLRILFGSEIRSQVVNDLLLGLHGKNRLVLLVFTENSAFCSSSATSG